VFFVFEVEDNENIEKGCVFTFGSEEKKSKESDIS